MGAQNENGCPDSCMCGFWVLQTASYPFGPCAAQSAHAGHARLSAKSELGGMYAVVRLRLKTWKA